ncbi:putative hydrolase of the HAD superfamily [Winogradskyella wandonensis]|uniref:Putative hydrolase of the HAD superfamily n=1 Tax=Winogradskyella wandonensis TaxID=1442586 RepID=A0A4R1KIW7_9FLAO|nr:HAD-IA family hydrolase [Winogradskyella wandonensis]TCK64722.1 putative hydrolase of the HAD superfamily [Winogradskyella wandonensis]
MIKTLIFDFGDVFINLNKQGAMDNALRLFDLETFEDDMLETNIMYEVGRISTLEFINFYTSKFPELSEKEIRYAWNYIIRDFPKHRLQFAQKLAKEGNYQLILLSNTNEMHIDYVKQTIPFYEDFKSCFAKFYLSHEIGLRKPNTDIFQFVLDENNLIAKECLFIDDTKENTDKAKHLGFHIWNIDETKEDVVDLFNSKSNLF